MESFNNAIGDILITTTIFTENLVNDGSNGHKRFELVVSNKDGEDVKLVAMDATSATSKHPTLLVFGRYNGDTIHALDLGDIVGAPTMLSFRVKALKAFKYRG